MWAIGSVASGWHGGKIAGHPSQNRILLAEGNEVPAATDRMPDGARGPFRHHPVDGFRHQLVIRSLPEVNRSAHRGHMES